MTPSELAAIHRACFTAPRPWNAAEFSELLDSETCFLCVSPNGFAIGRAIGVEAELLTLAVHPQSRRKGEGSQLLQDFETTCHARAVEEIFLEVSEENTAARALYQNAGFHAAGYRKDYYSASNGEKISALVLRKSLIPDPHTASQRP